MSQSQDEQTPGREVAYRVFATEFNDATHTFQESEEEQAPVYALLPTGAKVNRVFLVGTLTETNDVGNEDEYWQGRIVDPTATVFTYAGQYQPEAAAFLRSTDPPAFVAIVGKPSSYETDDGNINVSLRPEHISVVDAQTRNRWVAETASQTLDRIEAFDDESDPYARMATEQYGENIEQYRKQVIEALESLESIEATTDTDPTTGTRATDTEADTVDEPTEDSGSAPTETATGEPSTTQTEALNTEAEDSDDSLGSFDQDI
jgi:RPA family protein